MKHPVQTLSVNGVTRTPAKAMKHPVQTLSVNGVTRTLVFRDQYWTSGDTLMINGVTYNVVIVRRPWWRKAIDLVKRLFG